MIKIEPTAIAKNGYFHNADLSKIDIGQELTVFGQPFKVVKKNDRQIKAKSTRKVGGKSSAEHNMLIMDSNTFYRTPLKVRVNA